MSTIYWIEILDSARGILSISLILGVLWAVISSISGLMELHDEDRDKLFTTSIKSLIISSIIAIIFIFVPSSKSMYKIIGIGTTIEYLKSNEKAKQLPDKCINAIDRFLDSISEDEEKK